MAVRRFRRLKVRTAATRSPGRPGHAPARRRFYLLCGYIWLLLDGFRMHRLYSHRRSM